MKGISSFADYFFVNNNQEINLRFSESRTLAYLQNNPIVIPECFYRESSFVNSGCYGFPPARERRLVDINPHFARGTICKALMPSRTKPVGWEAIFKVRIEWIIVLTHWPIV